MNVDLLFLLTTALLCNSLAYYLRCVKDFDGDEDFKSQHRLNVFWVCVDSVLILLNLGREVGRQLDGTTLLGPLGFGLILIACCLTAWLGSHRYDNESDDDDDDDDDYGGKRKKRVKEEEEDPLKKWGLA